jgi:hypothetical protein
MKVTRPVGWDPYVWEAGNTAPSPMPSHETADGKQWMTSTVTRSWVPTWSQNRCYGHGERDVQIIDVVDSALRLERIPTATL